MNKKQVKFEQVAASSASTASQSFALDKAQLQKQQKPYGISNYQDYPQRLICYIRTKAYKINTKDENQKKAISKGTGCFIDENIFLTVGHNLVKYIQKLQELDNTKSKFKDQTYLKQGLGNSKYIRKYQIEKIFINPKYLPQKPQQKHFEVYSEKVQEDYAILLVKPISEQSQQNPSVIEQRYMPIVMLSKQGLDNLQSFEIPGYPVIYNKNQKNNQINSSCFMHEQYKTSGKFKPFQQNIIRYKARSQQGFSGAPIIAQYNKQKIIIAIHKGINQQSNQGLGVSASSMIQQLNQWGYQLKKKPFVFTDKTLHLRGSQEEMNNRQILVLTDCQLQAHDILVYTSYDLSNLNTIYLTGNYIGNIGVQYLLRRNYPNLVKLFLTQNSIGDLSLSNNSWNNLPVLQILSLGSNNLTTIPQGIVNLTKLTELWVTKNKIQKVPHQIIRQCFKKMSKKLSILIYENRIDFEAEKAIINELVQQKLQIKWKIGSEQ